MVLYLSNGKQENILSDDIVEKKKVLEEIISENLGNEAERLFNDFCLQFQADFDICYSFIAELDELCASDFPEINERIERICVSLGNKKPSLKETRQRFEEMLAMFHEFATDYKYLASKYDFSDIQNRIAGFDYDRLNYCDVPFTNLGLWADYYFGSREEKRNR